jgi:hypothetical protein
MSRNIALRKNYRKINTCINIFWNKFGSITITLSSDDNNRTILYTNHFGQCAKLQFENRL